jgi:hypothetical protein
MKFARILCAWPPLRKKLDDGGHGFYGLRQTENWRREE